MSHKMVNTTKQIFGASVIVAQEGLLFLFFVSFTLELTTIANEVTYQKIFAGFGLLHCVAIMTYCMT